MRALAAGGAVTTASAERLLKRARDGEESLEKVEGLRAVQKFAQEARAQPRRARFEAAHAPAPGAEPGAHHRHRPLSVRKLQRGEPLFGGGVPGV